MIRRSTTQPLSIALALFAMAACKTVAHTNLGVVNDSGGEDAGLDAPVEQDAAIDTAVPETGPVTACHYQDPATGITIDPVSLCLQKMILAAELDGGFIPDGGVASSWGFVADAATFAVGDGGGVAHDVHEDIGVASNIAHYLSSASSYGDTTLTPALQDALSALGPLIATELSLSSTPTPAPTEVDGELYFRLRNVASGLRTLPNSKDLAVATAAAQIDALAAAYAQAIYTNYFHALPDPTVSAVDAGGDAGDGGLDATTDAPADAGADAFAPSDGGSSQAGDASSVAYGVFGFEEDGGAILYSPADVVTGAYALFDMAARYTGSVNSLAWQSAAVAAINYVFARGLEPTTGLLYQQMLTSGAGTDTPVAVPPYPADALLTESQARAAYALAASWEMIQASVNNPNTTSPFSPATTAASVAYTFRVDQLVSAMIHPPAALWAGADGGAPGFAEGYVPSLKMMLTNYPTRANALMLGVLRHANADWFPTYDMGLAGQARLLTATQSQPNTNFLSVFAGQQAYVETVTSSFQLPTSGYSFDGGLGPLLPNASFYNTAANIAALDAMNDGWIGVAR